MQTRIIAVLNQKGGVGKSTIATNLAAAAHLQGKRTMVLDLDRQGTSFDWYAARRETSSLRGLSVHKADRVWTLPQLEEMTSGYEIVICDGPARLSDVSAAAAVAADLILIPIRAGMAEWWAAAETTSMLDSADRMRQMLGKKPARRVYVLNDAIKNLADTHHIREALAEELLPVVLHHRVAYSRALGLGESVVTTEPRSVAAEEVHSLLNALLQMEIRHAA